MKERSSRWKEGLIRAARAGDSWAEIGRRLYPETEGQRSRQAAAMAFARNATEEDREARAEALAQRGYNRPRQYKNRGYPGGQARVEPAFFREAQDPLEGYGQCFA